MPRITRQDRESQEPRDRPSLSSYAERSAFSALFPSSDGIACGSLQVKADSITLLKDTDTSLSLICLFGNFEWGELLSDDGQAWLTQPRDVLALACTAAPRTRVDVAVLSLACTTAPVS